MGRGPVRPRLGLCLAALALYAALFWPVFLLLERTAVVLAVLPIMTAALTFGRWGGLAVGLVMPLVFVLMIRVAEGSGGAPFLARHFWVSHSLFAGIGAAAGYLHELKERIRGQFQELQRIEQEKGELIEDLQEALAEVKMLSGLLPICSRCKKIRNEEGGWEELEGYIGKRSEAEFTHGICQECAAILYPELKSSKPGRG